MIFFDDHLPPRQLAEVVACTHLPDLATTFDVFFQSIGHPLSNLHKTNMNLWETGPADGNKPQGVGVADLPSEDKDETGEAGDGAGESEGEGRRWEPEAGRMLRIAAFPVAHLPGRPRRE